MTPILALHIPGISQDVVLLVLGLLIFGKRLPEVGRSLGKGIVEFKRGLKGIGDEIEDASSQPATATSTVVPASVAPRALPAEGHKFDPVTGQPLEPAVPVGAKFDPFTGKPIESPA
jgi:sec-independent protein translocase protein TatA